MKYVLDEDQKELIAQLVEARLEAIISFYNERNDSKELQSKYVNRVIDIVMDGSEKGENYINCIIDIPQRAKNKNKLLPLSTLKDLGINKEVCQLWAFYNGKKECLELLNFSQIFPIQHVDRATNDEFVLTSVKELSHKFIPEFLKKRLELSTIAEEFNKSKQAVGTAKIPDIRWSCKTSGNQENNDSSKKQGVVR